MCINIWKIRESYSRFQKHKMNRNGVDKLILSWIEWNEEKKRAKKKKKKERRWQINISHSASKLYMRVCAYDLASEGAWVTLYCHFYWAFSISYMIFHSDCWFGRLRWYIFFLHFFFIHIYSHSLLSLPRSHHFNKYFFFNISPPAKIIFAEIVYVAFHSNYHLSPHFQCPLFFFVVLRTLWTQLNGECILYQVLTIIIFYYQFVRYIRYVCVFRFGKKNSEKQ